LELALHVASLPVERHSYDLGNQLIRKSLPDSRIVVQVGRGVKEETCRIREVPTTCSRSYHPRDSNLESGILDGGRSILAI